MINPSYIIRILKLLIFCFLINYQSFAQNPKLKSTSIGDGWRLAVKTGAGTILTPVPEKYIERINNVNVPLHVPGPIGIFSVNKSITPHLEMGYQFDYMRIQGNVEAGSSTFKVLTQALTHTYILQYNFRETNEFKPLTNYFLYYKIGGISLKNDPLEIVSGDFVINEPTGKFVSNVAVLTGIGAGFNYQFSNNFSILGNFELNRSSDAVDAIYQINQLFYASSHSVNSYFTLSAGLSYNFSFSKQKKSTFFKLGTKTEKQLVQSKISRKKGISSTQNLSKWYNFRKGK